MYFVYPEFPLNRKILKKLVESWFISLGSYIYRLSRLENKMFDLHGV
jgi:hypothetical protein